MLKGTAGLKHAQCDSRATFPVDKARLGTGLPWVVQMGGLCQVGRPKGYSLAMNMLGGVRALCHRGWKRVPGWLPAHLGTYFKLPWDQCKGGANGRGSLEYWRKAKKNEFHKSPGKLRGWCGLQEQAVMSTQEKPFLSLPRADSR